MPDRKALVWKTVSYGSGALATIATRRTLTMAWNRFVSAPPPGDPADRYAPWMPALIWAIATGVGIGVMNLVAMRSAARVWEAATHETPPVAESS